MIRSIIGFALVYCAVFAAGPTHAGNDHSQPMQFSIRHEGPAERCGDKCRVWVSAAGSIGSQTPAAFRSFAETHELRGMTLTLDSDGGSVIGALELGREIRRLGMTTTVARTFGLASRAARDDRAELMPDASCESMCAFVLLGGARRHVPNEARVTVHQIWLGDRRNDAAAANYSAEDLVLVQHDIGRIVQYTAEMGGGAELVQIALKIPPWKPMYALSRDELKRVNLETVNDAFAKPAPVAMNTVAMTPAPAAATRSAGIDEHGWSLIDKSGTAWLARRHPLTVRGDEIGHFDLMFSCGESAGNYAVGYHERRYGGDTRELTNLNAVDLRVEGTWATLKIVNSRLVSNGDELDSSARGSVSAAMIQAFSGGAQ